MWNYMKCAFLNVVVNIIYVKKNEINWIIFNTYDIVYYY